MKHVWAPITVDEEEGIFGMASMKKTPEVPTNEFETDAGRVNGNGHANGNGAAANQYGSEHIEILEGLEPVRMRPGMYIGSTDSRGLHQLVYEVVDNSVDEAMAGVCDHITVTIHPDGSLTNEDNGRGIPVEPHPKRPKQSTLEVVMTTLHAGGKFNSEAYKQGSGGLHGVGVSAVNALSEWCRVEVRRNGQTYMQEYRQGKPVRGGVRVIGPAEGTGTKTTFRPDLTIMETRDFNFDLLAQRFREMAYINRGLTISIRDERPGQEREQTYYFEGGLMSFVRHLNKARHCVMAKPLHIEKLVDRTLVEIALQYNDGYSETLYSFANGINTVDGGTHLTGFRAALTRTLNDYGRKANLLKDADSNFSGDDVREGLTAVISVKLPNPQFESQTKNKLNNAEVRNQVESLLAESLAKYLEENPSEARKIIDKCLMASRARDAARKAKELIRQPKGILDTTLPGKLADCSERHAERCELFLVEGDSAGGCFSGDTRVALADGRALSFKELVAEQAEGKEHFCYTIRHDGTIGLERIINARMTKANAEVIRVTLDNGEAIICTPDHRFMLRDGSYKAAADLTPADSLMPLYRKYSDMSEPGIPIDGYEMVKDPRSDTWLFTQRKAALDRTYYHKTMTALRQFLTEQGKVDFVAYGAYRLAQPDKSLLRVDKFCDRYFNGSQRRLHKAVAQYNHRMVKIERLEERMDVYDIEVPGTHNFALASGVFVHNSAKQARDRHFQAILPLRGKILNVERARLDKMLGNEEIKNMVIALGTGIGDMFSTEKIRYGRVLLMTDADVDGSHIRTLLLTLFYRYMPQLISEGRLYIAQPPLYRIQAGKTRHYAYSDAERDAYLASLNGKTVSVSRYKGLGEMDPEELWETTMNPATRTILQVSVEDAVKADEIFSTLMGDEVVPRRRFIESHARQVKNLDI
jgi:DNA gyrase subunit B